MEMVAERAARNIERLVHIEPGTGARCSEDDHAATAAEKILVERVGHIDRIIQSLAERGALVFDPSDNGEVDTGDLQFFAERTLAGVEGDANIVADDANGPMEPFLSIG